MSWKVLAIEIECEYLFSDLKVDTTGKPLEYLKDTYRRDLKRWMCFSAGRIKVLKNRLKVSRDDEVSDAAESVGIFAKTL